MKYCKKCGFALADNAQFCASCGTGCEMAQTPAQQSGPLTYSGYSLNDKLPGLIILPVLFIAVVCLIAVTPIFSSEGNMNNILLMLGVNILFAAGMVIAARAKGPDLSLGATAALIAAIAASNAQSSNLGLGIFLAFFVALLIGAVNGALTVFLRIPSILVTLVTASILSAITYMVSAGKPMMLKDAGFTFGRLPVTPVVIILLVTALLYVVMYAAPLGKPLRQKVQNGKKLPDFFAYIGASLLFAFGGLVLLSRLGAASPMVGSNYPLNFLLILFLCGSSIYFEKVALLPVIVFAFCLLTAMLSNLLNLMNIDAFTQSLITGLLLLIALVCDRVYLRNIISAFKR
jgi:ribose/xylose/arabinose/galactoside ABC-type transport system permease subunit